MVVGCAIFTLGLGLAIWAETLQTRKNLSTLWGRESPLIQSLLQQRVCRVRPLPPLRFIATWDIILRQDSVIETPRLEGDADYI
jgi:hypothetical protein